MEPQASVYIITFFPDDRAILSTREDQTGRVESVVRMLSEESGLRYCHLTFHVNVLRKYLHEFPEDRDSIIENIRKSKLLIGPWYARPDAYICGGEFMVRNLLYGHRIAEEFGAVSKIGYIRSLRGMNKQLPQILLGFNIDILIFDGYFELMREKEALFFWKGVDEEQVLFLNLAEANRNLTGEAGGRACWLPAESLLKSAQRTVGLVMDAYDISAPRVGPTESEISNPLPGFRYFSGNLTDYFWELKDSLDVKNMPVAHKELMDKFCGPVGERGATPPDELTFTERLEISQLLKFHQCYTEPWGVFDASTGGSSDIKTVRDIWFALLDRQSGFDKNPTERKHGSIFYSIHRQKSEEAFEQFVREITDRIDLNGFSREDKFLVALNPLPCKHSRLEEIEVLLPIQNGADNFHIQELSGRDVKYQIIDKTEIDPIFAEDGEGPIGKYQAIVEFQNIPAMGYRSYQIIPSQSTRQYRAPDISPEKNCLENSTLRVEIQENGTFNVFSRETGSLYEGLGFLEDLACIETGQNPRSDSDVETTLNLKPQIDLLFNGPLRAAYKIYYCWRIPADWDEVHRTRTAEKVYLYASVILSLDRKAKHVNMDIELIDQARNHRVRVDFPINFNAQTICTGSSFDIAYRKKNGKVLYQGNRQSGPFPVQDYVGLSDDIDGFTILTDGYTEYDTARNGEQCLSLCIHERLDDIRRRCSVNRRLAFYPYLGNWECGQIINESMAWNLKFRYFQKNYSEGPLPPKISFITVDSDELVVSALKLSEHGPGAVLRLFNPTRKYIKAKVCSAYPLRSVKSLSLEEFEVDQFEIGNQHEISFEVHPKKIVSLELIWDNELI